MSLETILLRSTQTTPHVQFEKELGILDISGRSVPENAGKFFDPLLSWIDEYGKSPAKTTTCTLQFEYINSSSAKFILQLVRKLEALSLTGNDVIINWLYADEDLLDFGKEIDELIAIPVNIIQRD